MSKQLFHTVLALILSAIIVLIGNWIGYEVVPTEALMGMLVIILIAGAGFALKMIIPWKTIPGILYVAGISIIVSLPITPGSEQVIEWASAIDIQAFTTPLLAYAAIGIGNSLADFTKLGWKSIVIGSMVFLGTFLGSAIIAEIVLRIQGIV
ncbi:hypothetical protein [Oceanobacillus oncorhynchi]|uniref:hypothetical protein n=1 Tax=Oceanobacillus oncorhynchi TaxID=545501 RepID=UPI0025A4C0E1|nr:hypothetical protein [Oceanobacillus oncorhynchi]MDM8102059.1 hypothetical protein [Oceanobacillus oncorhynchi]